jgi:hypothetical protein
MEKTLRQVELEGKQAFKNCVPLSECPYKPDYFGPGWFTQMDLQEAWEAGWHEGYEEKFGKCARSVLEGK